MSIPFPWEKDFDDWFSRRAIAAAIAKGGAPE